MNAEKVNSQVRPLLAQLKLLSHKQREAATELLAKAADMECTAANIQAEVDELEADSKQRRVPRAVVNSTVHAETLFRIKRNELRVQKSRKGPLRAVRQGGEIKLESIKQPQKQIAPAPAGK
jgi:hypothetical protein